MLREQRVTDALGVRRVIVEAFGPGEGEKVADLAQALTASRNHRLGIVAEDEGGDPQIVGHVQLSRSWVDAARQLVEVLVLSPLSVLPAYQRTGVGRQLVNRAAEEARKAGAPMLFLEGNPAYYSRLGFEPALGHGFTRPSVRIPEAAFQVILLPGHEPWMTGALVYNEVFWEFDAMGLRSL
jgi:putative acetyltransferase